MAITVDYKVTFPFYRCGGMKSPGCNRLLTVFDELRAYEPQGEACGCGARQWRATNVILRDWFTSLAPYKMVFYYLTGAVKNAGNPAKPSHVV